MSTRNEAGARSKLWALIDETAETHLSITITGKHRNEVLLSEEDRIAINETLYLLYIPGLRESLREAMAVDLNRCSKGLAW